jgi:Holliday junction resolvasome RuvABC endonuclease subunit
VGLKAGQAEAGNDVPTRAQVAMDDHRMLEKGSTDPVVGTDNWEKSQMGSMVTEAVVGPDDRQKSQMGAMVTDALVGPDNRQKSQMGAMVTDAVVGPDNRAMGLVLD